MDLRVETGEGPSDESDASCGENSRALAFYSNDFEWEALRLEIEGLSSQESHIVSKSSASGAEDDAGGASSTWENFHKIHSKNLFFKERRYLVTEFPELRASNCPTAILEVGCGTGSSVVPILRNNNCATVYGCDCSSTALNRAVELVATQSGLAKERISSFSPFLCDICREELPAWLLCSSCRSLSKQGQDDQMEKLEDRDFLKGNGNMLFPAPPLQRCCLGGVQVATLIFTLSAIPVERMCHVLAKISAVLQPGGWLLFRDYGLYDMTMLRFPSSQRVGKRLYRRKDGTLSFFFTIEDVRKLFTEVGLLEVELHYCCVQLLNRRKQMPMKRVWVHGRFLKP